MDNRGAPVNLLTVGRGYLVLSPLKIDSAGNVVQGEGALLTYYEPFELYESPVSKELVEYVLGPKKGRVASHDFKLHTLFASLSPESPDELLRFMCKFGRLYYSVAPAPPPPEGPTQWYRSARKTGYLSAKPEPMRNFLAELRLFRWITEIIDLYSRADARQLAESLSSGVAMAQTSEGRLWAWVKSILDDLDPEDGPYRNAETLLHAVFLEQLTDISPKLDFFPRIEASAYIPVKKPRNPGLSWGFASLIGAMYLMLLLDCMKGARVRKCLNDRCATFFTATRVDQRYCTPECQQRAKQRRYIRKVRSLSKDTRE